MSLGIFRESCLGSDGSTRSSDSSVMQFFRVDAATYPIGSREPYSPEHNAALASAYASCAASVRIVLGPAAIWEVRFGEHARHSNHPTLSPTGILQVNLCTGYCRVVERIWCCGAVHGQRRHADNGAWHMHVVGAVDGAVRIET